MRKDPLIILSIRMRYIIRDVTFIFSAWLMLALAGTGIAAEEVIPTLSVRTPSGEVFSCQKLRYIEAGTRWAWVRGGGLPDVSAKEYIVRIQVEHEDIPRLRRVVRNLKKGSSIEILVNGQVILKSVFFGKKIKDGLIEISLEREKHRDDLIGKMDVFTRTVTVR